MFSKGVDLPTWYIEWSEDVDGEGQEGPSSLMLLGKLFSSDSRSFDVWSLGGPRDRAGGLEEDSRHEDSLGSATGLFRVDSRQ